MTEPKQSLHELGAELAQATLKGPRPAWLEAAYNDPVSFWENWGADLIAAAPGAPRSAAFEWYTLYHECAERHCGSSRAAFREYTPASGFRDVTYDVIAKRARSLATDWALRGVGPETTVCIVLEPSPAYWVSVLAAWCVGATVSIVPPDGPSFVHRALLAAGVDPKLKPGAPVKVFLVAGTKAKPWVLMFDKSCQLSWETPASTAPYPVPYRFPAGAIAARFFSPLADKWDKLVELSAEQLYLSALRDGILIMRLAPGEAIAAPGFSEVQFKPILMLMALACGATWVEIDMEELGDGRFLSEGRVDVLGVSGTVRDLLLKNPQTAQFKVARWFRNVAEDNDTAAWSNFAEALTKVGALGMNYFANAAAAGSLLFSRWSAQTTGFGVWRTPGVPFELGEPNGTGMPPLSDVAMLVPLKPSKRIAGIQGGLPGAAIGNLVVTITSPADILVKNLGSHRAGTVLPEQQIEELLVKEFAGVVRAAVLVSLPTHSEAGRERVALLVFTYPSDKPVRNEEIEDYLKVQLGAERVTDAVQVYELNPKLEDAKAKEPKIDRVACRGQYISGTLWSKSRAVVFRQLAALSQEVTQVRDFKVLQAASGKE